ncbi:MAG TPA: hypothetical protein DIW43_15970 [Spongiibacteraceae bacterium]|nr:hypothetical protein [Spongiibacteraceae bacterium]HCS28956.1 hypothetical protein [Spongiibacteraceae bacterium]
MAMTRLALTTAGLLVFTELSAFAQSNANTRSRPALEEVVVTAQKREEDVQSVPLSVTAIGGEQIVDLNMGDMNEVATYVPNLDILAIPTFPSIYIRGLGSSYNRGFEQSVAILIDEVFYGRASYITQGLIDLSAIEVLRGPQGTLFGKNSSAGAIHFRTAQPEYDYGFNGDVLLGDRNLRRTRLTATGPLIDDTLAWRVALLEEKRDGGVYNTTTDIDEENRDNLAARIRIQWDPSDNTRIGLTLNGGVVEQHGAGTQLIAARDRHLAAMRVFDTRTGADPYDEETSLDHAAGASRESWDITLKADWTLPGDLTLTSISNYSWMDEDLSFDADFSPIPFLVLHNDEDLRQTSQELRITSAPGEFEYVGGLYYLRTDIAATYDIIDYLELSEILLVTGEGERRLCVNSPDPEACQNAVLNDANAGLASGQLISTRMNLEGGAAPVETSLTRFNQLSKSFSVFGQMSWHLSSHWTLTLGARLNTEKKSLTAIHRLINNRTGIEGASASSGSAGIPGLGFGLGGTPGGSIIFPVILAGDTPFVAERARKDKNLIPKASVQYRFDDDVMTYASFARGYKSGGFNAQPVNTEQLSFDEEDAKTYELGLKSEWLGGAARFNITGFYTDFDGLQVAAFNGISYVVSNAASATIKGIEYEAMLVPAAGFLLSLNGAYTDAQYNDFNRAPCTAENTNPPPCDLSGEGLRLVPEVKTTLTAGYEDQIFNLPFITRLGITASYSSEVDLATDLDPIDIREAGTTYGLQVGIRSINDRWHIMLFGDNITGREYLAGAQDAPAFRGSHFGGAYPDASYELELGLRF